MFECKKWVLQYILRGLCAIKCVAVEVVFDRLLLLNQRSRSICFVDTENEYEIRVISFRKTTKRESQIYLMKSKTDWVRLKSGAAEAKPVDDHPETDGKRIVRGLVRKGLKPLPFKASISLRVDQM